ncbi:hypothetical protein [Vibrio vulnificus]|uniref:hypothetical protein n=1 Tax=Vibrio vulnificus TaxID=672 RepID=UPI0038CDC59D
MKFCFVIFNYNLPDEADSIYSKLVSDGVCPKSIIIVDNGSDKDKIPKSANFILPKNLRFTGQAYFTSTLLLDFYDYDYCVYITTSAGLFDYINYCKEVNRVINYMTLNNAGFTVASLKGGRTKDSAPNQDIDSLKRDYQQVFDYQPILSVISIELLSLCRTSNSAYFNLDLKRGWGIDRELQYVANLNNLPCFVSKRLSVEWRTNLAHQKGVADESVSNYRTEAELEMLSVFSDKYGSDWDNKFRREFKRVSGQTDIQQKGKNRFLSILHKMGLLKIFKRMINKKW